MVKKSAKRGKEVKLKIISCKLRFIDSARFNESLLSNFAYNLPEGILQIDANMDMIMKNVKRVELKSKVCESCLTTQILKTIY